jgi:hypothetical protein
MQSWKPRDTLHAELVPGLAALLAAGASTAPDTRTLRAAARTPAGQAAPVPLPPQVVDWLAQLTLLYGVPVEYLVPDTRLLPVESMRFFFVDRNWLDRMVDGALSVGVHGTRDDVFNEAAYEEVHRQVDGRQLTLRPSLRGEAGKADGTPGGPLTGLLMRSVIVSTWPGVEIHPTRGGASVPIVRMDRLSPDVLFCLFDGIPDRVEMTEPGEGLHFGVGGVADPDALSPAGTPDRVEMTEPGEGLHSGAGGVGDSGTFTVALRGLGHPRERPWPAGEQVREPRTPTGDTVKVEGRFRDGEGQPPGVLDVAGLVAAVEARMPPGALGPAGRLTPAGFAVQMVRAAGRQPFAPPSPPARGGKE